MRIHEIYRIFYKKQPTNIGFLLPEEKPKLVTFLNPYSIEISKKQPDLYRQFDYIGSDGIIPIILNKLAGKRFSFRISFDMTSFAPVLFDHLNKTGKSVYFLGSTNENLLRFVKIISDRYPDMRIKGCHHGYIARDGEQILESIVALHPDVTVIGMGTPLQDETAYRLHRKGYKGTVYTCGGFIHQTTEKVAYYPRWIDKCNLRALYRIRKEPYVLKRVLKYYPRFIWGYIAFLITLHPQK